MQFDQLGRREFITLLGGAAAACPLAAHAQQPACPWSGCFRYGGRGVLVLSNLVFTGGLAALAAANGALGLFAAWVALGVGMALGLYDAGFATLTVQPTSDQRSDQAQQFLFFWPATSRNKKGFDLNISDLAISYCTTS